MEFTVKRSNFQKELGFVQGIIEKKNTIPVLQNICITSQGNNAIEIIATDLDVSIRCICEAEVKKPGTMLVHARKLFDVVRSLPESNITLHKDDQSWAKLECERSRFRIMGQPEDTFPSIPAFKDTHMSFSAEGLRYMIEHTIFGITQEETQRFALNGAQFVLSKGNGRMIATDGHRLAFVSQANFTEDTQEDFKLLVPKKTLNELVKMLGGLEEVASKDDNEKSPHTVMFQRDENHLFFKIGKRELISRTLSGQFPNYELVMPKEINISIVFDRHKFVDALKRVALMSDEKGRGIKLYINDGRAEITSKSGELGEAHEDISVEYGGPTINVGFNSQYLLDFLQSVSTEEVFFELKDAQSQAQLRPKADSPYDYRYVVMPMRI